MFYFGWKLLISSEETVEVFFTNTDNFAPFRLIGSNLPAKFIPICRLQGNDYSLATPASHAPLHLVCMKKISDGFGPIQVAYTINFSQELKRLISEFLIHRGSWIKQN
ncbi:MAG: hypothetical protein CMI26_12105 [Opitutae bacterium]|nr:hypothetical protein [Opitutae bacterium]